jgi:hypothetical protein
MKPMTWIRVVSIAAAIITFGCAEQRPPIDRVQPYALDKEFFIGQDFTDAEDDPEFWTQATLIDVGYGAAQSGLFTSTWTQSMSRLRWQVTEDLLLGRLAYERIDNTDGKGVGEATEEGVVVVAFAIKSHFDIVNGRTPPTGPGSSGATCGSISPATSTWTPTTSTPSRCWASLAATTTSR